jgi:hypothetical protein
MPNAGGNFSSSGARALTLLTSLPPGCDPFPLSNIERAHLLAGWFRPQRSVFVYLQLQIQRFFEKLSRIQLIQPVSLNNFS